MINKLKTGNQVQLESFLKFIFPEVNILTNSKPLKDPKTGALFELDLWLPEYDIAFEYQDAHHYSTTWYSTKSVSDVRNSDETKLELARKEGTTLVQVPCWPFDVRNLCATIDFVRPDLMLASLISPISLNPPYKFFASSEVPDVGELMLASFFEGDMNSLFSPEPSWWMGEKYDGVRCLWNPIQFQLYTRRGLCVPLPETMERICREASLFLDCEIWMGRGMYLDSHRVTLPYEGTIDWPCMRMVTFDDATPRTMGLTFEKRYARLLANISHQSPLIMVAVRVECISKNFLRNFSQRIFEDSGEGLILRRKASLYEHGRNPDLCKIKVSRGDTEALVVEILPHGNVKLKLPSGILFNVPSDMTMLKVGDVVTFEYDFASRRELPVNPKIVRVRPDLSWRHVLSDYAQHPAQAVSNPGEEGRKNFYMKPTNFYKNDQEAAGKMRKLFEEFAHQRNLDPLLPETWYNITGVEISRSGGAYAIFQRFGGYIKSVIAAFPDLGLDVYKFSMISRSHWKDIDNKRQQLIQYARKHNFDPFVAENWAKIYVKQIRAEENISWVRMYGGSFWKAMLHIFPNIGLENVEFASSPDGFWTSHTRRKYFDKFAKEQGFDPLIPKNWYKYKRILKNRPKIRSVIAEFKGIDKTLLNAYPDIGLRARSSNVAIFQHWKEPKNRKAFFDTFAANNHFDPLVPENWYNKRPHDFRETAFARQVFRHAKEGLPSELLELYPHIGLQKGKFVYQ